GAVGGLTRGLPANRDVRVVELARRIQRSRTDRGGGRGGRSRNVGWARTATATLVIAHGAGVAVDEMIQWGPKKPNDGKAHEGRETRAMTKHKTGTREKWLAARLDLLKAEKELTRRSDEVARQRQELPWVRIDKVYRFDTDEGSASLADLFRGRSQLLIYHFMFG